MGTHESWSEVRRVFQEAVDRAGADRDAFLASVPAGPVLDEVRSLLDWHEPAIDFLESPAAPPFGAVVASASESLVGTTLGPWRIVDRIGAGGMGVVYRALRADAAFERAVALKVIGAYGRSAAAIERFQLERETLARLDHPAIARLLDGGTTPDGMPYFVMELVGGVPVDRYCDEQRLTIEQRLAVFVRIGRAVQYAHRNLVVHRDLKPDNILVLPDGSPKLLDFGVAKLLAGSTPGAGIDHLARATWAFPPDFASPEQRRGDLVTTASDVYALGVLLHLLLAGVLPFRTGPPTPPSQRSGEGDGAARAARRGLTPRALSQRLHGDLDAITMRAMAPQPGERYQTVDELLHDIERHQQSRPVQARPRSAWYVWSRLVARHKVGMAATFAALVLSAAGLGAIVWQSAIAREAQARAERRFEEQRALARVFMFDVHDAIVNVPGTTQVRALMVRTALQYLERLAAEAGADPSLRRELAAGFIKVGDAQGHPTSPNLGDTTAARASYRQGIALASTLVAADPDDLEAARTLAMGHRRLADVLAWMGNMPEALTHAETSTRGFAGVATRGGGLTEDRLQDAVGHIKLGDLLGNPNLPNLGRTDDAMAQFVAARQSLEPLARVAADNQRVQRYVGIVHERIGTLHEQAQRWSAAAEAYRQSFAIRQRLAALAPDHNDIQRDFAIAYEKLAMVARNAGHRRQAVEYARGALARFERLAAQDRNNAAAARSVAISQEHLGDALLDDGARDEAISRFRAAASAHGVLAGHDPGSAQAPCDAARVGTRLGDVMGQGRATWAACAAWRQADRHRRAPSAGGCALSAESARAIARQLARCGAVAAGAP